jgi:membrane-associated sensor protein
MLASSTEDNGGPPSRSRRIWVLVILFVLALLALALLPVADHPGPAMPGMIALFVAVVFVTDLSTSFLLFVRFRSARSWSLLVLGCTFFFSGLMSVPHLLTFPGAILDGRPVIGAGSQSTSWLYILWINLFALLSLVSVSLEASFGEHRVPAGQKRRAVAFGLGLTAIGALAIILTAVAAPDWLPALTIGQHFTSLNLVASYLGIALLVATIVIILLAIGEQNPLFLWLSLASAVMAFAALLGAMSGARFTAGWAIGRMSWMISACVLFLYLMALHARDQRLLMQTRRLLLGGAEAEAGGSDSGLGEHSISTAMQMFVAQENIQRYRRMLEEPHDEGARQALLRLLAEEESRLKQLRSTVLK